MSHCMLRGVLGLGATRGSSELARAHTSEGDASTALTGTSSVLAACPIAGPREQQRPAPRRLSERQLPQCLQIAVNTQPAITAERELARGTAPNFLKCVLLLTVEAHNGTPASLKHRHWDLAGCHQLCAILLLSSCACSVSSEGDCPACGWWSRVGRWNPQHLGVVLAALPRVCSSAGALNGDVLFGTMVLLQRRMSCRQRLTCQQARPPGVSSCRAAA